MLTYAMAKKSSPDPSEFGKGAIQGVAAPEAANNGASYGAMIPLFTLGIPGSATTAVLFGGLLMIGLQPGPRLFVDNPDFVWTVFGTFWIGNLMLVVLTSLLIPLLARVVFVSTAVLYPIVFALVTFGVYSINYSMGDVTIALIAGVVGYIMLKLDYGPVPLVLGLVLGPLVERGMRRTLILSEGDLSVFTERPIALTFLLLTVAVIVVPLIVKRVRPVGPPSI
jgi:putative tricarboxylic transport membrane protein